jgi:anti-sigma factor RsiW
MSHLDAALSAYLDGETDPEESARVVAHVGSCATCQAEMEALVSARRAVRSLPLLDLPPGLGPPTAAAHPGRSWRAVVGAAAAVAVLVSAIALGSTETVTVDEVVVPHVELARSGAAEVGR